MAYKRDEIRTVHHRYSLYDVASALQKSIRRGDYKLAGWMALELFPNYITKAVLLLCLCKHNRDTDLNNWMVVLAAEPPFRVRAEKAAC